MARDARHHLPPGVAEDMLPKNLTKQEFARRLVRLMNDKGWNQSELARQADLGRDSISSYVRARSFPEPRNLARLAAAFDLEPAELLPNAAENAIRNDSPSLAIREAAGHPDKMWLTVNQMVSRKQALAVMQILTE